VKYAYLHQQRHTFPVTAMCRVLRVSRSGYYAWQGRPESQRSRANRRLLGHIRRVHDQSRQHYGIIKAWKQLNEEGIACGRDRVARLRRTAHIYARRRKRFISTTRSKHRFWVAPNRLERVFTASRVNEVWAGDVTFIETRNGWLYLSVLLDLYSRKVVGWSMSNTNNGQLVKDALAMAIEHRQPPPGLIHHTDRGATYAMQSYRALLQRHGMVSSMSRTRDCWDNAVAESFFANLKNELTYWHAFKDQDEARRAIFDYIEIFYNRQRLHQTLNYQSPEQFEKIHRAA